MVLCYFRHRGTLSWPNFWSDTNLSYNEWFIVNFLQGILPMHVIKEIENMINRLFIGIILAFIYAGEK